MNFHEILIEIIEDAMKDTGLQILLH